MPLERIQLHASCVAINGKAVVLLGESGSGKSDLALRLMDSGATLVGDDQVILTSPSPLEGEAGVGGSSPQDQSSNMLHQPPLPNPPPQVGRELLASPAGSIEGMLEARGVGIMRLPYVTDVAVVLAVKLVKAGDVERLPEPQFFDCLGHKVPLLSLNAFESSTPAKIRVFLSAI